MTTLYKKLGRRYVPVSDTDAYAGLPNGDFLVRVREGHRSSTVVLDADKGTELLVGLADLNELICEELKQAMASTIGSRELTAKERKAWKAWQDVMGEGATLRLSWPSIAEVADRVVARIREKAAIGELAGMMGVKS